MAVTLVSMHPERLVANQNDLEILVFRFKKLFLGHTVAITMQRASYLGDNERSLLTFSAFL